MDKKNRQNRQMMEGKKREIGKERKSKYLRRRTCSLKVRRMIVTGGIKMEDRREKVVQ